ncbi:MAG: flagellar type III secretion system pore protein FliP [Gemmatimonadales bacterium]
MTPDLIGLVAAFAITGGLLVLALRLLKRIHGGYRGAPRLPFEIVQRHGLGPKQSLSVVRIGSRVLVLGMSDHGSRLLAELKGEDRATVLEARTPPGPKPGRSRDPELRRLLSRLTLALALTAVPSVVAAQADSGRVARISPPTAPAPAARARQATTPANGPTVKAPESPGVEVKIGRGSERLELSGTVGLVVFLGALTLLPAVVLLMTSFTRILVVLHFLRSALGTQGSPPGQLLVAIAVLLTGVVMQPVLEEANRTALQPYLDGQVTQADAYQLGLAPFRRFMLANVRERDLATFTELSGVADVASLDDVPTMTVVTAFVMSELQAAFWMGFVIFLPFVVVDLIVATSLMSLGMFMVPPVMISLPFKLLLFVLADGWSLVGQNLVASFQR